MVDSECWKEERIETSAHKEKTIQLYSERKQGANSQSLQKPSLGN